MTLGIKVGYITSLGMNNSSSILANQYLLRSAKPDISNFNIGAFGRIDFNNFYLQPELQYIMGENNYALSLFDSHIQNIDFIKTLSVNTLDIPLLFGYKIWNSKNTNIRVFAGPKLRMNAGSSVKNTIFLTQGTTVATAITTDITPIQCGLETGLGFDFSCFTLDARYNLIQDMYHSQLDYHTIDNLSANTLVVSLGWKVFRPKK